MKANGAPERIYLVIDPVWGCIGVNYNRNDTDNTEYIRTDAFIEKAAAWVSMNFDKIGEHYFEYVRGGTEYNPEQFIENIKNYMRGE